MSVIALSRKEEDKALEHFRSTERYDSGGTENAGGYKGKAEGVYWKWYTGKTCSIILDSGVCSVFIREYALRLGSMILKASISWRR